MVLGSAALLIAIGVVLGVWLRLQHPLWAPGLSRKEQAIVVACADALLPPGGALHLSGVEAGVVSYIQALMCRLPERQRLLIHLLLAFVEHGPRLYLRRALTRQTPEARVELFEAWRNSPSKLVRAAATSVRLLVTFAYLAHPQVCLEIGARYDPQPFERARGP